MAYYAALVSIVQSLEKISNREHYPKFLLNKQQIASLCEKLSHLQVLLEEDYSPKDEDAADCLERRIRDAAYQVQYILESQDIFESKLSYLISQKNKSHGVENVLHRLLITKWKREMPRQLQEIEKVKEEVDSIVEEVRTMKIKKSHTTEDLENINDYSASKQNLTRCGDTMVGFEEQLATIKEQICGESSKLEVIPLVGMGGIGKTTLARGIFNDELITYSFDCRVWVTVSQDYHQKKILLDIMDSMNIIPTKNLHRVEKEVSKESIYKHLKKQRRYLIIIDDIWDTKVWDDVKRIFPDDNNGSRIILTTRLLDVAIYALRSPFAHHEMQFLKEDQSWNLLRDKVFAQENCPQELEVIGRLIAKNCRGLPLAIVVVAGLLSKVNKTRYDWEKIARNVSSTAVENDEHFSNILSLSYNQLPHHLKPCFLYMGGFPEDYEIPTTKLIKLWIAEGLLKLDEFKSLEETGEEYLEDLVKRNLVLITKKKTNSKFKCCSIHDVLRDLCMKRACHESFLYIVDDDNDDDLYKEGTRNIIRRLYIHYASSRFMKVEEFGSHISSIICFHDIRKLLSFASRYKLLRVLDALEVRFFSFPVEVLKLYCLRYLAFGRRGSIESTIPPGITKLEELQTLVVGSSGDFYDQGIDISSHIWKMPHLRHVIANQLQLSSPFSFACILENLQTLSRVVNFRFTNRAIQMIPNLRKLKLVYNAYEPKETLEKFCLYNLVQLFQLETLDIDFLPLETFDYISFPENFAFPKKLKKLSLGGCKIPWKNMTAVGSLPCLQVLKLRGNAFVGDEWEPIEGEFSQLKFLLMQNLNLKYWRAENIHFPRLEHLKIRYCKELEEIPLGIGDIPTLKLIEVYCNESAANSALQIQEGQLDIGNDLLQVHVYNYDWNTWKEGAQENWEKLELMDILEEYLGTHKL